MKAFTTLQTSTGTIRVNSNESKRHFTIKTDGGTFRTIPMTKREFEESEMNTGNDWVQFLKTDEYYRVK